MPKRHGLMKGHDKVIWVYLGISQIVDALVDPFRKSIIIGANHSQLPSDEAVQIRFHFGSIISRLLHSLDLFQRRLQTYEQRLNLEASGIVQDPRIEPNVTLEAGIFADAVIHYLNIFLDDIARVVPYVMFEHPSDSQRVIGFGPLKKKIGRDEFQSFPDLTNLFSELDNERSWWHAGFGWGQGIRQRIVHYTDIITFQETKRFDENQWRSEAFLLGLGREKPIRDIENVLRALLAGFFSWLDGLEQLLINVLKERANRNGLEWSPSLQCPRFLVPVERSPEWREISDGFLYMPVCDGSLPLKGKVRVFDELLGADL